MFSIPSYNEWFNESYPGRSLERRCALQEGILSFLRGTAVEARVDLVSVGDLSCIHLVYKCVLSHPLYQGLG